jgi:chemotaxis response regulator CheB
MPDAAIAATAADAILPLEEIGKFVYGVCVREKTAG